MQGAAAGGGLLTVAGRASPQVNACDWCLCQPPPLSYTALWQIRVQLLLSFLVSPFCLFIPTHLRYVFTFLCFSCTTVGPQGRSLSLLLLCHLLLLPSPLCCEIKYSALTTQVSLECSLFLLPFVGFRKEFVNCHQVLHAPQNMFSTSSLILLKMSC